MFDSVLIKLLPLTYHWLSLILSQGFSLSNFCGEYRVTSADVHLTYRCWQNTKEIKMWDTKADECQRRWSVKWFYCHRVQLYLKKRPWHKYFLSEIFKYTFLQNNSGRLLLEIQFTKKMTKIMRSKKFIIMM